MYFKFDTVQGNGGGDHGVKLGDQHINVIVRFNYLGALFAHIRAREWGNFEERS